MSLKGFWYTIWTDYRLRWNPDDHGHIRELILSHSEVWKPPLIVSNEVNTAGLIDKTAVPLRVYRSGMVVWKLPITMKTTCEVNVQNYPFDSQECSVDITAWEYTVDELQLSPFEYSPVINKVYTEHGEWAYKSYTVKICNISGQNSLHQNMQFKLKFKRRWQFYSQYLILPIMMNSVLMISVFVVQADSGEKLGFSLTVLLSYIVLLTIVTENLPPISTGLSVLQLYLSVLLALGTLTTILTIWILKLHNRKGTTRIPFCLQKLTDHVIAPIVCLPRGRSNRVEDGSSRDAKPTANGESLQSTKFSDKDSAWEKERMSYRDFAVVLDKLFFRMFGVILFAVTLIMILFFVY